MWATIIHMFIVSKSFNIYIYIYIYICIYVYGFKINDVSVVRFKEILLLSLVLFIVLEGSFSFFILTTTYQVIINKLGYDKGGRVMLLKFSTFKFTSECSSFLTRDINE